MKLLKSPVLYLISFMAFALMFSSFSVTEANADSYCLKKNQRVNARGRVKLKNAIKTTDTTCPKGYIDLPLPLQSVDSDVIADNEVSADDLALGAQPAGADFVEGEDSFLSLDDDPAPDDIVKSITVTTPASGVVVVNASGYFDNDSGSAAIGRCSITTGTTLDLTNAILTRVSVENYFIAFAGTRGFSVNAGENTFNLVCDEFGGDVSIHDVNLTAIYTPVRY